MRLAKRLRIFGSSRDHSSYVDQFHFYTSHLAFSPNGKYLATSDYFGNIVIWSCDDFSILHSINMPNHARTGNKTMRLRFLPSDEAGLIIETCDEETEKEGFWFMDARYPMEPVRVAEGMRFGGLQWCEVGVLLSQYKHAVDIYSYQ